MLRDSPYPLVVICICLFGETKCFEKYYASEVAPPCWRRKKKKEKKKCTKHLYSYTQRVVLRETLGNNVNNWLEHSQCMCVVVCDCAWLCMFGDGVGWSDRGRTVASVLVPSRGRPRHSLALVFLCFKGAKPSNLWTAFLFFFLNSAYGIANYCVRCQVAARIVAFPFCISVLMTRAGILEWRHRPGIQIWRLPPGYKKRARWRLHRLLFF